MEEDKRNPVAEAPSNSALHRLYKSLVNIEA